MMKCFLSAIMVLAAVGCSRKSDNSSVTFNLPARTTKANKVGALAVSSQDANDPVLKHVVLNISGPNMPRIVRNFDSHQGSVPSTISLDIPKGDNRLFQVLAVYESPTNSGMLFYYGDRTQTLSNASESVDMLVGTIGGSIAPPVMGNVYGRYFTSSTGGPTGDLAVMYNPGPGKARMTIERGSIYNGWFSVFGMTSVPFEYEIQPPAGVGTPELMFGGPVSLNSDVFNPSTNSGAEQYRVFRMAMPISIREESGGTPSFKMEEARYFVWGFWKAPGVAAVTPAALGVTDDWATMKVCHESTDFGQTLTKIRKFDAALSNQNASLPGLHGTSVGIGSTLPSDSMLLDPASPLASYSYQGGWPSVCGSPSDVFTKFIKVTNQMIDGNGGDSAGGFRGPFRASGQYGNVINVTGTGAQRTLSGTMLPGVAGSVDEFRVFKKTGVGLVSKDEENIECGDLVKFGYIDAGSTTVNPSLGNINIVVNISDADATGGTNAFICGVRSGLMLAGGYRLGTWAFTQGSGGGGGGGAAAKLAIETPSAVNTGSTDQCYGGDVMIQDTNGSPAYVSTPVDVVLTANVSAVQFYLTTDSGCTGASQGNTAVHYITPSSTNGSGFYNQIHFNYKVLGGTAATLPFTFNAVDFNSNLTAAPVKNVTIVSQFQLTSFDFRNGSAQPIDTLITDTCVGVTLAAKDAHFSDASFSSGTATVSTTGGLLWQGPSPGGCFSGTGGLTSISTAFSGSAPSTSMFFIKVPSAANINSLKINVVESGGPAQAVHSFLVGQPGVPLALRIDPIGNINASACNTFNVSVVDAGGALANVNAPITLQLSNMNGSFSTNCPSGSPLSPQSVTIAAGSPSIAMPIYFQAGAGQSRVDVDVAGTPFNAHQNYNIGGGGGPVATMTSVSPLTNLYWNTTLHIYGTNFLPGDTVNVYLASPGNYCTPVTYISSTELTCPAPAMTAPANTYAVHVDVNGTTISNLGGPYNVTYANQLAFAAVPAIYHTMTGATLHFTGNNFTGTPTISIGGNSCAGVTVTNANNLTCIAPTGPVPGSIYSLYGVDSGHNFIGSGNGRVQYHAPAITAISPTSTVSPGQVVNFSGTDLPPDNMINSISDYTITIGGQPCINPYTSGTYPTVQIFCTSPTGLTAGSKPVTINYQGLTIPASSFFFLY